MEELLYWCSPKALLYYCAISKLFSVPKRAFNVNSVPLIASSPIEQANFVQNATCYYSNTIIINKLII